MKTLIALLIPFLLSMTKSESALSYAFISDTQFYSVSASEQGFNGRLIEQGTGTSESQFELGIGPSGSSITYTPTDFDQYSWVSKIKHPFSLTYTMAGNLVLNVEGGVGYLTYQPVVRMSELFIGNRNQSGASSMMLNLTNLSLNGMSLPDIKTTGNAVDEYTFSAIAVNGVDFNDDWNLVGEIEWDTGTFDELVYNNSKAIFMGVKNPTGLILEPSVSLLTFLSLGFLWKRRR